MKAELKGYVFTLVGLALGAAFFGFFRSIAPAQLAFGTALIGVCAGTAGRMGGALGTMGLLRFIIFGTLFSALTAEYVVFSERGSEAVEMSFSAYLLNEPLDLFFNIAFMAGGIFLGVRLIFAGRP